MVKSKGASLGTRQGRAWSWDMKGVGGNCGRLEVRSAEGGLEMS